MANIITGFRVLISIIGTMEVLTDDTGEAIVRERVLERLLMV